MNLYFFEISLSKIIYLIFGLISVVAIIVTVYDKYASKKRPKNRISEKSLAFIAILGGSVAMYLTMRFISHKTKHKRFMIGLPILIFLQIFLISALYILIF